MKIFSIILFLTLAISIPNNSLFGFGGHGGGGGGGSKYLAERHELEEGQREEFKAKQKSITPQQKSTIVSYPPSSQSSMKAEFFGGGTPGSALDVSALIAQQEEKKQKAVKKLKKLSKSNQ